MQTLKGIHLLLTYTCNFECEHCFLYCGPHAQGTFTLGQVEAVLDQAQDVETVDTIYFEGGEPFLYYPLMVEGIRLARARGFQVGIVTNCYWATTEADAELWLKPLADLGVFDLSVSDDTFHHGEGDDNPAKRALRASTLLGIHADAICIEEPYVRMSGAEGPERGQPIICGGAMFRGRAVEQLAHGLPTRPWQDLTECPYEDLLAPSRVHVDCHGHVQLCQGLSMGNIWETQLSSLLRNYDPDAHPVCEPLLRGGPAALAREYDLQPEERYVDECHLCYSTRLALVDRFPQYLAPRQVYGLE
jgi:hypothetical protein